MNYHKFAKLYSFSRISRYLKASKGDKKLAQDMYYANSRIAQAFQPLISSFEVILRNQLHYAIANHFSDVRWLINQKTGFMSDPSLIHKDKKTGKTKTNDFLKKEIERSEKALLNKKRNLTSGRIIAELNFGFWNSLFESHHYALLKGVPCTIFHSLPKDFGRKEVNSRIRKIRDFLNRVSHNEPICFDGKEFDLDYSRSMYTTISNFLTWVSPNVMETLASEDLDKVNAEIIRTEKILARIHH